MIDVTGDARNGGIMREIVSRQPGNRFYNYHVDFPCPAVGEQFLELWAVFFRAGHCFIGINSGQFPVAPASYIIVVVADLCRWNILHIVKNTALEL